MSIIGFIPSPETAATSVAWVRTLADEDEETIFLCLETGFAGRTAEAVRAALGEQGEGAPTLIAINDPMPVAEVLIHVRKMRPISKWPVSPVPDRWLSTLQIVYNSRPILYPLRCSFFH